MAQTQAQTSAAQRQQEIQAERDALLLEMFPNKKTTDLHTFGFTIKDCARLIGESLSDEGLLGWFVHLTKVENGVRVGHVTVSCMVLTWEENNGVRQPVLGTRQIYQSPADRSNPAAFKVFSQLNPPNLGVTKSDKVAKRDETDPVVLQSYTNGVMTSAPQAKVEFLEQHLNWARASFLRRTDLKIMQTLLLAQPTVYNDFFFSGAKVDYNTMHDSKLRVDQFTLEDSFGDLVPDSSKAFTLKAEPIFNNLDDGLPDSEELVQLLTQNVTTRLTAPTPETLIGSMFPAAVMGAPCPDYWDWTKELSMQLKIEDTSTAKALLRRSQDLAIEIEQMAANNNNLPGGSAEAVVSIPLTDIVPLLPIHPLHGILTFLISLFTSWANALINYRNAGRLF